ncbi:MAG TPA: glutamate--cysteine ligase [Gammaproteobacteria bacterium]|nr:glutamate--cysteine ligase [Gammaproteobacteria bacterium]
MGQEIRNTEFSERDFVEFRSALVRETRLLKRWFDDRHLSQRSGVAGFELEAWLIDQSGQPAPVNTDFLSHLDSEWVSPELSLFNVELNVRPAALHGDVFSRLYDDLQRNWLHCRSIAEQMEIDLVMTGILPSVQESQLVLANMSRMKRYRALNEQVFRHRNGRPLQLDIVGREHLRTTHYNVMLEAATTSFQIHLQVNSDNAVRYYNASIIASAPVLAVAVNSPYLFGHDIWDETRIPLFEQSVATGGFSGAALGPLKRVGFGSGYARQSLFECFAENLEHFPILLPMVSPEADEAMQHLRLHNGTIWRWNRPLLGVDEKGKPHLRIEHRAIPAGPTVIDAIANAAFFYGLVNQLATSEPAAEAQLPFTAARDNFYAVARYGLDARLLWFKEQRISVRQLLLDKLIPAAEQGLTEMKIDKSDIKTYLGIIRDRVSSGQTGAAWQRAWVRDNGTDMRGLTLAYAERQHQGQPVHEW